MRIGHGYDLHRLEPAPDGVIALAGVRIPAAFKVLAHSDGDVAIHALCDALLGATADGDIGQHFPDTDLRWRDADSRVLLRAVVARVFAAGYRLANTDITIIAETPRVAPHVAAMRTTLAADLGCAPAQVSIKATTNEGLGEIGARRALAAHAVVLLQRADN